MRHTGELRDDSGQVLRESSGQKPGAHDSRNKDFGRKLGNHGQPHGRQTQFAGCVEYIAKHQPDDRHDPSTVRVDCTVPEYGKPESKLQ
jgi:hypothetical protein